MVKTSPGLFPSTMSQAKAMPMCWPLVMPMPMTPAKVVPRSMSMAKAIDMDKPWLRTSLWLRSYLWLKQGVWGLYLVQS